MNYKIFGTALDDRFATDFNRFMIKASVQATVLVNEYNRKRDAWQMAERKQVTTGDLDFDRIMNYKTSTDLFKTTQAFKKGQSHGVVMLIDGSASMQGVLQKVIEQAIVVGQFCLRVKIPFDVYFQRNNKADDNKFPAQSTSASFFETSGQNPMFFSRCHLTRIMTSVGKSLEATNHQMYFCHAMSSHIIQTDSIDDVSRKAFKTSPYLRHLFPVMQTSANTTPLYSAMLALIPAVRSFKRTTKVDNVTTLVLSDGENYSPVLTKNKTEGYASFVNFIGNYNVASADCSMLYDEETRRAYSVESLVNKQECAAFKTASSMSICANFLRKTTGTKLAFISLDSMLSRAFTTFTDSSIKGNKFEDMINAYINASDGTYCKFENMMGFDSVSLMRISAQNVKTSKHDVHTEEDQAQFFDAQMAAERHGRILAIDIASLICKEFELQPRNTRFWYERTELLSNKGA